MEIPCLPDRKLGGQIAEQDYEAHAVSVLSSQTCRVTVVGKGLWRGDSSILCMWQPQLERVAWERVWCGLEYLQGAGCSFSGQTCF